MSLEQTPVEREGELELPDSPYPRPLSVRLDASFMRPVYRTRYERKMFFVIVIGLVLFGIYVTSMLAKFSTLISVLCPFWGGYVGTWVRKDIPEETFAPTDDEQNALAKELTSRSGRNTKVQIVEQGAGSWSLSIELQEEKTRVRMAEGLFDQLTPRQRLALVRSEILWDSPQLAITVITGVAIITAAHFMNLAWYWTTISYLSIPLIYWLQWREAKQKHNRALAREGLTDSVTEVRAICKELKRLSRYVKPYEAGD